MYCASGKLLAWRGEGTSLPLGFAALRMETFALRCVAMEAVDSEARRRCTKDPVQLLCRALRMAPTCYRQFELVACQPDSALQITGNIAVFSGAILVLWRVAKQRSSTVSLHSLQQCGSLRVQNAWTCASRPMSRASLWTDSAMTCLDDPELLWPCMAGAYMLVA